MGKKESLNNTTPRVVKEVPKGYKEEIQNGKKVYVFHKEKPIPKEPLPVKSKPIPSKPSGTPRRLPPPKPKPVVPDYEVYDDIVTLEEPIVEPTQKVQSLRTDLQKITPPGLQEGYHMYKVPDLTKGANYTNARDVITDNEGMPVVYDFKQNKYVQTGEPNIHLNMPVQNDTPTIQDALAPNELPTKFDVVPERLRVPSYNKAKVTTPTVDESIYKGFNEVGNTNNALNDIEFKKEQDKNLAIPKLKNGGGISAKVKGYYNGGNVDVFGNPTTSQSVGTTASGNPNSQNNDFTPTGDSNKSKGFYDAFNYDKSANKGVISQSDAYGVAAANAKQKPSDTTTSGVVGITDAYSDAKKEQDQKSREVAAAKKDALTASSMAAVGNVQKGSTNVETATNLGVGAAGIAINYLDDAGKDDRGRYKNVESAVASKYLKGTAIGAQFGSIIGPWGTLIGAGIGGTAGVIQGAIVGDRDVKAIKASDKKREDELKRANDEVMSNQAILARNNGEFDFVKSSPYTSNNAMYDDNDNLIRMNKGGIVSKIKGYSDGGQIKGKGTGKSDSILAKVKAGSFIVPAENAEAAEELREKFLGKPPKSKANLNEKGGETVKLSNGEHKFTPEEKHELLEKGVNVDALAPDSKVKAVEKKSHIMFPNVIGYGKGGVVDPTKELAKIEAERKAVEAIKAKKESDQTAAEKARLQKFILEARATNQSNKVKEWEKKYGDAKTKLDALNKSYEDASKEFKEGSTPSTNQKGVKAGMGTESQRKYKEDLLKKIQEAKSEYDNAKRTYDYVKSGKTYTAPKTENKATAPQTETKTATTEVPKTTTTKPSLKAPRVSVPNTSKFVAPAVVDNGEDVVVPNGNLSPNEAARIKATEDKAATDATALNNSLPSTYTPTATYTKKRSGLLDRIGNVDPTALVGIGQSAVGYNMLKDEKRPVDKAVLDATYNGNVNRAIQDAKFGLTPEQRFAAEQDIQNGLNDAKAVGLNYSGGNGVQAFNTNRAAINDAWKNKLGLKQADTEMRMNKQMYADQQVANRANILAQNRRRSFEDAMSTFQQKQQAGSELIGAGLANTIGAYRYNKDLQAQKEANLASNEWTRQYGQTM